jgi:hypothetical protein
MSPTRFDTQTPASTPSRATQHRVGVKLYILTLTFAAFSIVSYIFMYLQGLESKLVPKSPIPPVGQHASRNPNNSAPPKIHVIQQDDQDAPTRQKQRKHQQKQQQQQQQQELQEEEEDEDEDEEEEEEKTELDPPRTNPNSDPDSNPNPRDM